MQDGAEVLSIDKYFTDLRFAKENAEMMYSISDKIKTTYASVSGNQLTMKEEFKETGHIRYTLRNFQFANVFDIDFVLRRLFPLNIEVF